RTGEGFHPTSCRSGCLRTCRVDLRRLGEGALTPLEDSPCSRPPARSPAALSTVDQPPVRAASSGVSAGACTTSHALSWNVVVDFFAAVGQFPPHRSAPCACSSPEPPPPYAAIPTAT